MRIHHMQLLLLILLLRYALLRFIILDIRSSYSQFLSIWLSQQLVLNSLSEELLK